MDFWSKVVGCCFDADFGSDSASARATPSAAVAVVVILILVLVIYGTRSLTSYHCIYFFSHGGPRNGNLATQPQLVHILHIIHITRVSSKCSI